MIHNMTGGAGGSVKHYAAVSVTYPAGAILTCSNGSKVLTAGDTSGKWMFTLPSAGEWTVTATKDGSTKSQTVTISAQGQHESVVLSFTLVIFDAGTYAAETGGFKPSGANVDGLLKAIASTGGTSLVTYAVYSNNLIDLTEYTTLHFQIAESNIGYQGIGDRRLGISSTASGTVGNFVLEVASNAVGERTIDISDLSGAYAILLYVSCRKGQAGGDWVSNTLTVSKIWAT